MLLALTAAVVSCTKEPGQEPAMDEENLIYDNITLGFSPLSKSTIDSDGTASTHSVNFSDGDAIIYYSECHQDGDVYKTNKRRTALVSGDHAAAEITLGHAAGDNFYALLFPGADYYSSSWGEGTKCVIQDYNVEQFGYSGINPDQTGEFGFANIAVAYVPDITNMGSHITLKNITSILKFSLPADNNVKSVSLLSTRPEEGTGNEINGQINVDMTSDTPVAWFRSYYPKKGEQQWTSTISDIDSENAKTYYFAVMPGIISGGYRLRMDVSPEQTVYSTTEKYLEVGKSGNVTFNASEIKNVGNLLNAKTIKSCQTTTINLDEYAVAKEWVSGTNYPSVEADGISIIAEETSGAKKNGMCYDNMWRFYQNRNNGTFRITCPEDSYIESVMFTYNYANGGIIQYGENTYSSKSLIQFTDQLDDRTFTVCSTNPEENTAQVSIKEIQVTLRSK